MRRGFAAAGVAYGGGTDMAVKGPVAPPPIDCQPGVWTKLIGSWGDRNGNINMSQLNPALNGFVFDTSYHQGTGGALVGVDYSFPDLTSRYDSLVLSVMGGYIESIADFNSPNTLTLPQNGSATFTGGTVAASGTYMNGGFFIDALLKADFLSMNVANIPGALCSGGLPTLCGITAKSTTWGTVANVGYRFEAGRYFIEPIGSVEWTNNRIGASTWRPRKWSSQFKNDRVDVGGVWDIATDPNKVTFVNPGPTFQLHDSLFTRAYGEAGFQLDWLNRYSGWSAYLRADEKFNNQFNFFTGKAGLRYAF